MKIINSRVYQGFIPITNYIIIGFIAVVGFCSVILAYPIFVSCIHAAVLIRKYSDIPVIRTVLWDLRNQFWLKMFIGILLNSLLIFGCAIVILNEQHLPFMINVAFTLSTLLIAALSVYVAYAFTREGAHFKLIEIFIHSFEQLIIQFPYTLVISTIFGITVVLTVAFPLSIFITSPIMIYICALIFNRMQIMLS